MNEMMNEIEALELKLAKMHTETQDVYRLLVSKKEDFLRSLLTNPSLDESKMKKAYYLEHFCIKFFIIIFCNKFKNLLI
jgi:hypothetical protein